MKKIMITGASGLLGQALMRTFSGKYQVIATAKSELPDALTGKVEFHQLDISNAARCKDLIQELDPDVIINAAAYTNVDGCEDHREICWRANVKGVENLAVAARKNMALLVQLSTDYIFDGEDGPYDEDDTPNPLGYYGKAKLASENAVRVVGIPYAIIRTNVIFGTGIDVKNNFFLWLYNSLKAGKNIRVVTDQYNNPVAADDLALGIRQLVDESKYGVFHMGGKEYLNRYEFAVQLAEVFGFSRELITPIETGELQQKAPRPMKGGLKIDKAANTFGYAPRPLKSVFNSLKNRLK